MLLWRLVLGPILIAALVGILWLDARQGVLAPGLALLALALGVRSVWEMVALLRVRFQPAYGWLVLCTVVTITANWIPQLTSSASAAAFAASAQGHAGWQALGPPFLAFALSLMVLLTRAALTYHTAGNNLENLAAEVYTLCYVAVLASFTVQLRWVAGPDAGYLPLGSLIVATKCGDTMAFTFGKLFGRHKLIPRLSPGKTWEGAAGAVVGAAAGSWLWFGLGAVFFTTSLELTAWYWAVLYGAVLGVVGLVGDLCESFIKRDVGQKDSAPLLPGFGGLLDLLDSIFFAGPAAYLLWVALPLLKSV